MYRGKTLIWDTAQSNAKERNGWRQVFRNVPLTIQNKVTNLFADCFSLHVTLALFMYMKDDLYQLYINVISIYICINGFFCSGIGHYINSVGQRKIGTKNKIASLYLQSLKCKVSIKAFV